MDEYIRAEINEAIRNYKECEHANEWKVAEEEFKKISHEVEELIFGNGNSHTDKVSHQAIRYAQDIPNDWEILGNILYDVDIEERMPCILFTWLLNMDKKLWGRLQSKIKNRDIAFKDKRIARLLAKSTDEVEIVDLFFYKVSEIPKNDYDFAFMMVIRFLTLFELPICAKADKNICMTWFENEYGMLRHIFTNDEKKDSKKRAVILDKIMYELSQPIEEKGAFVKYFSRSRKQFLNIYDQILSLDFSDRKTTKKKFKNLVNNIYKAEKYFLLFRYEVFKSNYALNIPNIDDLFFKCASYLKLI